MKMSVLYYTRTGHTRQMAECIVRGMAEQPGVGARAFSIDQADEDFVRDSRCVILGTPTYFASTAAEVKTWLDTASKKLGLAGKLGGAFATEDYLHGGGDLAIQSILVHMMVLGMLVYSGGGSFGPPVIHLGPAALGGHAEEYEELFRLYGSRMASKALELFPQA